jgi:hypothetical protein
LITPVKNEVMIVEALSTIELPETVIGDSGIKYLLSEIIAENAAVADSGAQLDRARQEKKAGNVIGNWLHNRDEKVQGAQLDLNRSIGNLTQKSSQLLVFNTAISRYLTVQQRTLLKQQELLKQQAEAIEIQNGDILVQQKVLEKQQREINAANHGLMEAKGISQEQAQALVGCVKRVSEAESRMDQAGRELTAAIELKFKEAVGGCIGRLNEGFDILETRHKDLRRELNAAGLEHTSWTQTQFEQFATVNAKFIATSSQQRQTHLDEMLQRAAVQDAVAHKLRDDLCSWLVKAQQDSAVVVEAEFQTLLQLVDDIDAKHILKNSVLEDVSSEQSAALQDFKTQIMRLESAHLEATRRSRVALLGVATVLVATIGWQIAQYLAL